MERGLPKARVLPREKTTLGKCRSLLAHPIRIRSRAASSSAFLNLTARPILKLQDLVECVQRQLAPPVRMPSSCSME